MLVKVPRPPARQEPAVGPARAFRGVLVRPEFNSTKKEKKSCKRFKQQDFLAFKNDIKSSHITEALSNEYLS
jgi:hypothetical protein